MSTIGLEDYRTIRNRGDYAADVQYIRDDLVTYNGGAFVCKAPTRGNVPTNETYWGVLAAKGDTGPQGPPGAAFDPEAPQTIKAPWTFVVPAGQSFRVTDGEEVPDFEFSVHNRSSLSGDASQSGFRFRASADEGTQYMEVRAHKVLDIESPNYGDGLLYIDMGGVSFLLTVNDAGLSVLESDVDIIRLTNTPVYSSNAAALAGGLTAGMRYRKSTGELYEVY